MEKEDEEDENEEEEATHPRRREGCSRTRPGTWLICRSRPPRVPTARVQNVSPSCVVDSEADSEGAVVRVYTLTSTCRG